MSGIPLHPEKLGARFYLQAFVPGHHSVGHDLAQRKQYNRGEFWLGFHHVPECFGRHEKQMAQGLGQNVGGALGLAEHGHFADEASSLDCCKCLVLPCSDEPDTGFTGEDHEQTVAGAALLHDDAAFLDLHHHAVVNELFQLRLTKPRQYVELPKMINSDRLLRFAYLARYRERSTAGMVLRQSIDERR